MKLPVLRRPWFPIIVCVLLADLNFWYWASTEENDADYLGIAFFVLFAVYWGWSLASRRRARDAISGLGSALAAILMTLRVTGTFDRGFIPPYVVFIIWVLLGFGLDRSSSEKGVGAAPEGGE